jgi:hypothetical protein
LVCEAFDTLFNKRDCKAAELTERAMKIDAFASTLPHL